MAVAEWHVLVGFLLWSHRRDNTTLSPIPFAFSCAFIWFLLLPSLPLFETLFFLFLHFLLFFDSRTQLGALISFPPAHIHILRLLPMLMACVKICLKYVIFQLSGWLIIARIQSIAMAVFAFTWIRSESEKILLPRQANPVTRTPLWLFDQCYATSCGLKQTKASFTMTPFRYFLIQYNSRWKNMVACIAAPQTMFTV